MPAADLHAAVQRCFEAADVEGLVALYEDDACLLDDAGGEHRGHDAIRALWTEQTAFGGNLSLTTLAAIENGDTTLLSNRWAFSMDGTVVAGGVTAEVARRQPDGSWKYVIDNPYVAEVIAPDAD